MSDRTSATASWCRKASGDDPAPRSPTPSTRSDRWAWRRARSASSTTGPAAAAPHRAGAPTCAEIPGSPSSCTSRDSERGPASRCVRRARRRPASCRCSRSIGDLHDGSRPFRSPGPTSHQDASASASAVSASPTTVRAADTIATPRGPARRTPGRGFFARTARGAASQEGEVERVERGETGGREHADQPLSVRRGLLDYRREAVSTRAAAADRALAARGLRRACRARRSAPCSCATRGVAVDHSTSKVEISPSVPVRWILLTRVTGDLPSQPLTPQSRGQPSPPSRRPRADVDHAVAAVRPRLQPSSQPS